MPQSQHTYRPGDIIHIDDFSPTEGSEMRGRHYALIVSDERVTSAAKMAIVLLITSKKKRYPTNVEIVGVRDISSPVSLALVDGEVCCLQIRAIDVRERGCTYIGQTASRETMLKVRKVLRALMPF